MRNKCIAFRETIYRTFSERPLMLSSHLDVTQFMQEVLPSSNRGVFDVIPVHPLNIVKLMGGIGLFKLSQPLETFIDLSTHLSQSGLTSVFEVGGTLQRSVIFAVGSLFILRRSVKHMLAAEYWNFFGAIQWASNNRSLLAHETIHAMTHQGLTADYVDLYLARAIDVYYQLITTDKVSFSPFAWKRSVYQLGYKYFENQLISKKTQKYLHLVESIIYGSIKSELYDAGMFVGGILGGMKQAGHSFEEINIFIQMLAKGQTIQDALANYEATRKE